MPRPRQTPKLPKFFALFFIFYLVFSAKVIAQTNNCAEKFKAYNANGLEVNTFCIGETIRFKSCADNAQPDKEYYDANKNDGLAFPDTTKSVSYTAPGTYTVTQLINTGLPGSNQFERTFTVVATPDPQIHTLACAYNKINLKITDTTYDIYHLEFGDGTERRILPGKDTVFLYKASGNYTLTLKAAYRNASCSVRREVTINTLPILITPELQSIQIIKYGSSQGSIALQTANLQPEYTYVVERAPVGSTGFLEIQRFSTLPSAGTINISNTDTRTTYQYRLRVTDSCGTATGIISNILINQPIKIIAAEKEMRLSWSTYPAPAEVINYQVYRGATLVQSLPATVTSYVDAAVACGRQYCYYVVAQFRNNRFSRSNDTCQNVIAIKAPPKGIVWATFNQQNQVLLQLQVPVNETFMEVVWQKNINNSTFSNLAQVNHLSHIDSSSFSENNQPCYQAAYTDSCGLTSENSNLTCPVILKGSFNSSDNKVILNWSPYVGFSSAFRYTVEVSEDATGQLLQSYRVGSALTFTDTNLNPNSQLLAYRIKVTGANPAEVSYSNKIVIAQNFSAFIPTAFSPNSDGLNDVFEIKGRFINTVKLRIYNRWGQVIFESKNPNEGWNGKINGQDAPVGTYVYSFTAQDLNGNTIQRKGSVTLIK